MRRQARDTRIGISASEGCEKGLSANIDKTATSIRLAIEAAERMAGATVSDYGSAFPGPHQFFREHRHGGYRRKDGEITSRTRSLP